MSAQADRIAELVGEAPIDAAALLSNTEHFISRFCSFPEEHALVAATLWTAHTHMVEHFHTTPRLALLSPEAASGKTRVLEVLNLLVPEPMFCFSASPAAIFRTLSTGQITLLVDETDTIFQKHGKDDGNEDLRALLNAGYKRGATIPRCFGPKHEVAKFKVFAATALAGLGDLPDTVMSRSVIIRMKRRAPDDPIEPFRSRVHEPEGHRICDRLAAWADQIGADVEDAWPELPEGITDRPAEVWEPLIAVADAAGGDWPNRARAACLELVKVAADRRVSLGLRLLSDVRIIFGKADALHTETILKQLTEPEKHGLDADAPWADLRGKPLDPRRLATMLKQYDVKPEKVWESGRSLQGYRREPLWDAWQRYLPPLSDPAQAEGAEGREGNGADSASEDSGPSGPSPSAVPEGGLVRCSSCDHYRDRDRICDHHGFEVDNPQKEHDCPDHCDW